MRRYVLRRLLMMPLMWIGITFVIFALVNANPGSPALIILGAQASQDEVDALNHLMGYDQPFLRRYVSFLANAVRGDFGESYFTGRRVIELVMYRLPNTLRLTAFSLMIAILIGVPLGMTCAVKQYSHLDTILSTTSMFIAATPTFWLAVMMMLIFCLRFRLLPATGVTAGWKSWVLPVITLAIPYVGIYLRYSRSCMLDTIREDYVRTARSKGNSERVILFKHALRNALLPLITVTGIQAGMLMASATVTETVFTLPGLGTLVLDSIKRKDIPLVLGCITFYALFFFIITLVMDVLYAYVDPRIKAMYTASRQKKTKRAQVEV